MIPLRSLGQTKHNVSRMGLGLAALGRPGYINLGHAKDLDSNYGKKQMEARAHTVLSEAYQLGVRYFDAARSYGLAEAFLATWLAKEQPENVTIGSKWGYTYTANWQVHAEKHEVKEHSLANLNKQCQESKELLGKHLNLYQIHSATLDTGVLTNHAIHERLFALKQEGLFIGLSLSGPEQSKTLEQALKVQVEGQRLFDAVQATFNIFETSAGKTLELAHQEGMGIIIKEALANGRLTSRNSHQELGALAKQTNRLEVSEDAIALAWVLQHEWADVVLSGAAKTEHLKSNSQAFKVVFDEEALTALAKLEQSPRVYWQRRSSLVWN